MTIRHNFDGITSKESERDSANKIILLRNMSNFVSLRTYISRRTYKRRKLSEIDFNHTKRGLVSIKSVKIFSATV